MEILWPTWNSGPGRKWTFPGGSNILNWADCNLCGKHFHFIATIIIHMNQEVGHGKSHSCIQSRYWGHFIWHLLSSFPFLKSSWNSILAIFLCFQNGLNYSYFPDVFNIWMSEDAEMWTKTWSNSAFPIKSNIYNSVSSYPKNCLSHWFYKNLRIFTCLHVAELIITVCWVWLVWKCWIFW